MPPPPRVRRRLTAAEEAEEAEADLRGHTVLTLASRHVSSGVVLARLGAVSRAMRQLLPPIPRDMPSTTEWKDAANDAARTGRLPALRWILSLDPSQAHGDALRLACAAGQLACAELLIAAGAAVEGRGNGHDQTPLHHAFLAGQTRCAELLLDAGATPRGLVVACEGGHVDYTVLLLSRGVRPSTSALKAACARGHLRCVRALLAARDGEQGAETVHWLQHEEADALANACRARHMPCVAELLQRNPPPEALQVAMRIACANGDLSCAQLLFSAGSSLTTLGGDFKYPLDLALNYNHAHVVSWILEQSATADDVRCATWPMLNNSVRCMRLMLDKGIVINDWPLLLKDMCEEGALECVELLLDRAANLVNTSMLVAALSAPQDVVVPLVELLLERGAHPDHAAKREACQRLDAESLERLLAADAAIPTEALLDVVDNYTVWRPEEETKLLDCLELLLARGTASVPLLNEALLCAARKGYPRCAQRLLAAGADPNCGETDDETTPLLVAAAEPHVRCVILVGQRLMGAQQREETVRLLLAGGARVTRPILLRAIQKRDHALLALLLPKASPSALYRGGKTPLVFAASEGAGECLHVLLYHRRRSLHTSSAAMDLQSALSEACRKGNAQCAERLIWAGAAPDTRHLKLAITRGRLHDGLACTLPRAGAPAADLLGSDVLVDAPPALVWELMRTCGAALEWRDEMGQTLLFKWCDIRRGEMRVDRVHGIVRQLLAAGADPNAADAQGATPLHTAAQHAGAQVLVQLLVHAGAAVDAADHRGVTPLMCAATVGNVVGLRALIDAGAALDPTDASGRSALTCAASGARLCAWWDVGERWANSVRMLRSSTRMLRNAGAVALDETSRSALEWLAHDEAAAAQRGESPMRAAANGELTWLRVCLERDAAPWGALLHEACANGQAECAALLLERGAAVDPVELEPSATPLVAACGGGHVGCVARLLAHGPHRRAAEEKALEAACEQGAVRCVELLVAHGAPPTARALELAQGCVFCTRAVLQAAHPKLCAAALRRFVDPACTELLLAHGADPNATAADGTTPLLVAAVAMGVEVVFVELLLAWGADVRARDEQGRTALDVACRCGDTRHIAALADAPAHDPITALVSSEASDIGRFQGLRALLRAAPWRVRTSDAQRALEEACACRNGESALHALIESGVRPGGETAWLVRAMERNEWAAVEPLIRAGADLERRGPEDEQTPLQVAASMGNVRAMRLLIRRGASVDATCDALGVHDATALLLACAYKQDQAVRLLLRHGASIHRLAVQVCARENSKECLEALLVEAMRAGAMSEALRCACRARSWRCITPLLRAGAVDAQDDGESALEIACGCGEAAAAIRRLLAAPSSSAGPEVTLRTRALVRWCECRFNDAATARKLLASGALPSVTAVHAAAASGNRFCLRVLLEAHAEASDKALRLASAGSHHECVRLLLDAGAQPTDEMLAATQDATTVRMLMDALPEGVLVDKGVQAVCMRSRGGAAAMWELLRREPSPSAWPLALFAACTSGNVDVAQMVIEHGEGIAGTLVGLLLFEPMSAAVTRLLLEHVPVNVSYHDGTTALMTASARGDLEVVRVLLGKGASVDARRADGKTALRLAAEAGHAPVVRELVHNGGAALPAEGEEGELERECAAVLHDARM